MSLINQMLRDLESRNPEVTRTSLLQEGVFVTSRPVARKAFGMWSVVGMLLLVLGGSWFYQQHHTAVSDVSAKHPITVKGDEFSDGLQSHEEFNTELENTYINSFPIPEHSEKTLSAPVTKTSRPFKKIDVAQAMPKQPAALASPAQGRKPLQVKSAVIKRILNQQEADLLYQQAGQDHSDLGLSKLQRVLVLNPQHLKARLGIAKALHERGSLKETAELLDDGLLILPQQMSLVIARAQLFLEQKNPGGALKILQSIDAKNNQNETYLSLLAAAYQQLGDYPQAAGLYQQLVKLNPEKAQHWLGLGLSQEQLGDVAEARDAYQQALAKNTLKTVVVKYINQRLVDLK